MLVVGVVIGEATMGVSGENERGTKRVLFRALGRPLRSPELERTVLEICFANAG